MKTKNENSLKRKLTLNKETLSVLNKESLKKIVGGDDPVDVPTDGSDGFNTAGSNYTCWSTFYTNCSCGHTCDVV